MEKFQKFLDNTKKGFIFVGKNIKIILILLGLILGAVFILTLPDRSKYMKLFFEQIGRLKDLFKKQDTVVDKYSETASKDLKEAKDKIGKEGELKKEATSVDTDKELKEQYEKFKNSSR